MPAITIPDLNQAKQNTDFIDRLATSSALTTPDRLGRERRTFEGIDAEADSRMAQIDAAASAQMAEQQAAADVQRAAIEESASLVLAQAGYAPPVLYTAGLAMTLRTQTVDYGGNTYAPKVADIPFVTSGTFEAAKFRLIQGISGADLALKSGGLMVGTEAPGTGAILQTVSERLNGISIPLGGYADPAASITQASLELRPVDLPAGVQILTAPLNARTITDKFRGFRGMGQNRSIFRQTTDNVVGINIGGRYAVHEGYSVEYANQQGKDKTGAIGIAINDYTHFSRITDLTVDGAYIGIAVRPSGESPENPVQFSNIFGGVRVSNWYETAWSFGSGDSASSGTVFQNMYASAIQRPHVIRGADFTQQFGGQVLRLNIERCTVLDRVLNLETSHNFGVIGLNFEEVSLCAAGASDGRTFRRSWIYSSGQGNSKFDLVIMDSCHIGGHLVTNLTRVGNVATATVHLMDMQQKKASGPGFTVGGNCFMAGVGANGYAGAHVVTGVGAVYDAGPGQGGKCDITFTVAGDPPSPCYPADGNDCITLNIGNQEFTSAYLFDLVAGAGNFEAEALHIRDMKVIASTPAKRRALLRWSNATVGCPGKVRIGRVSTRGQQSQFSHWVSPVRVAGYSRTGNVMTVLLTQRHNLAGGTPIRLYDTVTEGAVDSVHVVTELDGLFGFKFESIGADVPLTRQTNLRAMLETFSIISVSRANGFATYRTAGAHTFRVAHQAVVRCSDASFHSTGTSGIDTALVSSFTSDTFTVRNVGADQAEAAVTGSAMLVEAGLASSTMYGGEASTLVEVDGFFDFLGVSEAGSVPAGGSITRDYAGQMVLPRDSVEIIGRSPSDPRLTYAMYPRPDGTAFNRLEIGNPTAAPITSPAFSVRYRTIK